MAVVAVSFTHYERSHKAGDVVDDDDPLVAGAPHLFVQPDPEDVEPVVELGDFQPTEEGRIRGALAESPKKKR